MSLKSGRLAERGGGESWEMVAIDSTRHFLK